MSAILLGDLMEWRRTPAAKGISDKEFIVLIAIADRVLDERSRMMRRFKGDDCELYERLCQIAGVTQQGLKKILQRLYERGLEVRVVYKYGLSGEPIYACRGHAMDFRLPELPAVIGLPARSGNGQTG